MALLVFLYAQIVYALTINDTLTCSSSISSSVDWAQASELPPSNVTSRRRKYSCGSPYNNLPQTAAEDIYQFTCQATGSVTLRVSDLNCDLDIYILNSTADTFNGCITGATKAGIADDTITFSCTAGQIYHVVVEGYGASVSSGYNGYCNTQAYDVNGNPYGMYTLDFDVSLSTGCPEDCVDGIDNDLDGALDCADSDCDNEPLCTLCDVDGDGASAYMCGGPDCNDNNPNIFPGSPELCDGVDNNCNGLVDDGVGNTYYIDADGDGYGNINAPITQCGLTAGVVANSSDCNDNNASIRPNASEVCDGVDNDCDGLIDDLDNSVTGASTFYSDVDADGFGATTGGVQRCTQPAGYVSSNSDCNDNSASVYPGATEVCDGVDNDCDTVVDEGLRSLFYADADADGFGNAGASQLACVQPAGYVTNNTDCNDVASSAYPGATEVCDLLDNDCDTQIDEGVKTRFYADADADTYGNPSVSQLACTQPAGYVTNNTDCNDGAFSAHPGATEVCDLLDNDCDTQIDEGVKNTYYLDGDTDGFGLATSPTLACTQPAGYVSDHTDCDDGDLLVFPGATEICDLIDNNCDGVIDEGLGYVYYLDVDNDTYGDDATQTLACSVQPGYVSTGGDCDDTDIAVNPSATEVCDLIDNNCDGVIDEGLGYVYYTDLDNDTYGDEQDITLSCTPLVGYVSTGGDCNDTNTNINPSITEVCDTIDNNCDSQIDEGLTTPFYVDIDQDGYGDISVVTNACTQPVGYVSDNTDCDDTSALRYPSNVEICDTIDNNCDNQVDEGLAVTWYLDADGDNFGIPDDSLSNCAQPPGYVLNDTDCDDMDAGRNPSATEVCDSLDNNCNGVNNEGLNRNWYADADLDSFGDTNIVVYTCSPPADYVLNDLDCNDQAGTIYPNAPEICDYLDNDCDSVVDEGITATFYEDQDGDDFGNMLVSVIDCQIPVGYVTDPRDCDDTDASVFPLGIEIAYDGIDQNCDGEDLCDVDGDGFLSTRPSCGGNDCVDSNRLIYPGRTELPDGIDQNCDGIVDDNTINYDDDGDGFTERGGDCDDANVAVLPTGIEECDGYDNNCNGTIDETTICYDDDGDGYTEMEGDCNDNNPNISPSATEIDNNGIDDDCNGGIDAGGIDNDGDGFTDLGGDCDDNDPKVFPNAQEEEDGLDNNCNGIIDDQTNAYDDDGDGLSENDGDCNDANPNVHPSGQEVGNGYDDNCNGFIDEGTERFDDDGDGYTEVGGDCDDSNVDVSPAIEEIENGIDDDCDGMIDEGFVDLDGDGFLVSDGDCNDLNGWVNPEGVEVCDGLDNNCNGVIDETCGTTGNTQVVAKPQSCSYMSGSEVSLLLMVLGLVGIRRRNSQQV